MSTDTIADAQGLQMIFTQEYSRMVSISDNRRKEAYYILAFIADGLNDFDSESQDIKMRALRSVAYSFMCDSAGAAGYVIKLVLAVFRDDMTSEQRERVKQLGFKV